MKPGLSCWTYVSFKQNKNVLTGSFKNGYVLTDLIKEKMASLIRRVSNQTCPASFNTWQSLFMPWKLIMRHSFPKLWTFDLKWPSKIQKKHLGPNFEINSLIKIHDQCPMHPHFLSNNLSVFEAMNLILVFMVDLMMHDGPRNCNLQKSICFPHHL